MFKDTADQSSDETKANKVAKVHGKSEDWVVAFRPAGGLLPIFCICAAGGDAHDFRDLALALPDDQPVYVFGLPPLGLREAFPTVRSLSKIFIEAVRKRQPHGPYRLSGHSFGGLVAYEMALLLTGAGETVDLVAMIDTLNPAFKRNMSYKERTRFHAHYVGDRLLKYGRNLAGGKGDRVARDAVKFVHRRCRQVVWKVAGSVFGRLGRPAPGPIHSNDMILVSAWRGYDPRNYTGRLVLLNCADRPPEYGRDHTLGWARYATGPIDIHVVPGDHLSIMRPPQVQTLAERIARYLSKP